MVDAAFERLQPRCDPLQALGGADVSWIVGLVVPGVMYYVWASRRPVAPDAPDALLEAGTPAAGVTPPR